MFGHLFVYRLKSHLRSRELIFWTLFFPLLLATFFYFAFGHLTSERESFEPVPAAVVDSPAYREDEALRAMLKIIAAEEGESRLLELTVTGEQEALSLLEEGSIAGVIVAGEPVRLIVKNRGLLQSILQAILDDYNQTSRTATNIITENPQAAPEFFKALAARGHYTQAVSFSKAAPDTNLAYFHALIAMACLYSAFWGIQNTLDLQANLSAKGARRSVAPTHKMQVVLTDSLATLVISFFEVLVLLAYLTLVLKVNFGSHLGPAVLTCLAGCLAGAALGNFIGTAVRGSEGLKIGVLLAYSMTMSFLAGLMFVNMKYLMQKNLPFVAYINPAALIADAFYSLYTYPTYERFWLNILLLLLFSAVLSVLSFLLLRRERYAGI